MGTDFHTERLPPEGVVSSQFLFRVFRSCLKLGARQPVLLEALGLDDSHLRNPLSRFSVDTVAALCRATAGELDRNDIHARIASQLIPNGFSDAGYAGLFENSYGECILALLDAQDLGVDQPPYRMEREGGKHRLVWQENDRQSEHLARIVFWIIAYAGIMLSGGAKSPAKAIYFAWPNLTDREKSRSTLIKDDVVCCFYNQPATYLELNATQMSARNGGKNARVVRARKRQRDIFAGEKGKARPLTQLCYNYLVYLLDKPGLSLDAAAETFSMAERTIRRKLVNEGTSFRQILERVRRDNCQLYFLEGTRSLSEIATKLGYSELSAFTRAYTAWYGRPPSKDLTLSMPLAA